MRNREKTAVLLAMLLASIASPLMVMPAMSEETSTPMTLQTIGNWTYIQNDLITIVFPADGKKPMFLWWYTKDPDNINVVKFKGLVEYSAYERPYFLWRCQADRLRLKRQIQDQFYEPKRHMFGNNELRMGQIWRALAEIGNYSTLHAPFLPFSSSTWELDGPTNVTRGTVKYLSFNFTLAEVPGQREHFKFAEDNIIIRCRFYYTPATEDAYGKYSYTVNAGELKIDLVVKHWEWNTDKINQIIQNLNELGLNIPKGETGLALWINLASINMTKLQAANDDAQSPSDTDFTEGVSVARNMYVEGNKVSVAQDNTENDETPLQNRGPERFRIRLEKGNATFAGFFKFVPQAIVTDGTTYDTTDVTASYTSAGAHMRLFIGYPYFGNKTLIHDPSIGVENVIPWMPTTLLFVLIGATIVIAVAVSAVRLRKKTVDILTVK